MVNRRFAVCLVLAWASAATSCLQQRAIGQDLFACDYGGTCACQVDKDCNDGNACTVDHCDADLGCSNTASTDPCEDGNPCTINDHCVQLSCKGGPAKVCDDHDPCTSDSCGVSVGCTYVKSKTACNDGDPCTIDTCDASGCAHAVTTGACDDGDACTLDDTCASGTCKGAPTGCDDANPCTVDACDATSGCTHSAKTCDDSNPCTSDTCDSASGACKNAPIDANFPFYCPTSEAICGAGGMCWGPTAVDCSTVILCPDACHACATGQKFDCEKKGCF